MSRLCDGLLCDSFLYDGLGGAVARQIQATDRNVFRHHTGLCVLRQNIDGLCAGQPLLLLLLRPQRRWLALVSTGNQYAVALYGGFGFAGAWAWQAKNAIDQRFVQRLAV